MSYFQINQVIVALVTLLQDVMPTAYNGAIDIDTLGDEDFDESGQLVLTPPSMRVRYRETSFDNLRDNRRLTYQAVNQIEVLCFESSLASKADERAQTMALVVAALNQLAGARLTLADGSTSMPITIRSCGLVVTEEGPVDQLMAIGISIEGISQFDGPNAGANG